MPLYTPGQAPGTVDVDVRRCPRAHPRQIRQIARHAEQGNGRLSIVRAITLPCVLCAVLCRCAVLCADLPDHVKRALLPSLTAPWRMGFARDKITARGRGPLARSARRAESSPPRSLLPPPLSPLPARLSAPTRTARPIARAPHKRNGQLGQTRSDIIAFAAPAPVHRTAGRRALHPGRDPRGVSVGGPRHPAASRTDTFMRPGAAPSWPSACVRISLGARALFLGCPRCVPGVCPSAEGQTAVCSDVRPEGYPARACRAVVPWAMQCTLFCALRDGPLGTARHRCGRIGILRWCMCACVFY